MRIQLSVLGPPNVAVLPKITSVVEHRPQTTDNTLGPFGTKERYLAGLLFGLSDALQAF